MCRLFSYLLPEQRVPADQPLRTIRAMTDEAVRRLSPRFEAIGVMFQQQFDHLPVATPRLG